MHTFMRHLHFRYTELNEMYISMSIKSFSLNLISIFIPIYLYRHGYAMQWVFGYLLLEQIFKILTVLTVGRMVAQYGAKHIMAGGYVLMIAHMILLYTLPAHHWPLSIVALISGLATNAHWLGYHINFARAITKGRQGHDYSIQTLWISFLAALGPFVGGYIASRTNLGNVFLISLALTLAAGWPLFRTSELFTNTPIVVKRLSPRRIWHGLLSYIGIGIDQQAAEVVWPFFIFLSLTSYATVGLVTTISLLLSLLVMYGIGNYSDKGYQQSLIKFGAVTNAFLHVLRVTTSGIVSFVGINSVTEVVRNTFQIPWYANFYTEAEEEGPVEYVLQMQIALDLSRIIFWGILLVLSFSLPLAAVLKSGFLIAAFASFLIMLARVKKPLS